MNKKSKGSRPSGEHTRQQIILAAKQFFVQNGYDGTSISMIANQAQVNRSLIFHHFTNKAELWIAVKKSLVTNYMTDITIETQTPDSIDDLIDLCVNKRLQFYQDNPDYFRLLCWQVLGDAKDELNCSQTNFLETCIQAIEHLQNKGAVRTDMTPKVILVSIFGSIYSPFLLQKPLPLSKKELHQFMTLNNTMLKEQLKKTH